MSATFLEAAQMARLDEALRPITPQEAAAAERVVRARLGDDADDVLAALGLGGAS